MFMQMPARLLADFAHSPKPLSSIFCHIELYSLRNIRIEESRGVSTTATILGHTIRSISDMMGTCRVSENQIIPKKWLECKMKKDFLQFIPKISKEFLQFLLFFGYI